MRILTVKMFSASGVILVLVLLVIYRNTRSDSVYSSEVPKRARHTGTVYRRKAEETIAQSKHLASSDSSEFVDICFNTTLPSTGGTSTVNLNDMVDKRFKDRKNVLMTSCNAVKERETHSECDEADVKRNLKYSERTDTVYCAIEKAGSTFWKRILYIIGGKSNVSNPTNIKTIQAEYSQESFRDMTDKSWDEIDNVFKSSKSIMFVRNPYARLFSAWLDKFYSPNIIYWNTTGRAIVRSQRQSNEEKCASDITFSEFVNHTVDEILSGNRCVDRHFAPNYKHCNPCKLSFDYIGKYETMKEDTLFILNNLNLKQTVTFSDFDDDAALDAIKDATDWIFYQKDKLSECGLTFHCALFRVWQRLKSRGFISSKIPFPFLPTVGRVTPKDVESILRSAHGETIANEAIRNRIEALSQALSSLPENVKQKVLKAFGKDFDMFGYVRDPKTEEGKQSDDTQRNTYFTTCPSDM